MLTDAGVAPADAIVADDSARALEWAAEAGVRTVLVGRPPSDATTSHGWIASLAGLPALLTLLEEVPSRL
jgi:FMN phosphatase YigB (HAD superfamily)